MHFNTVSPRNVEIRHHSLKVPTACLIPSNTIIFISNLIILKIKDTSVRGKAKRKIHARYPFLGDGTYQPPVLSVLYFQVGYQLVAADKSRVIYAGPTRFPYPLSDNYTRGPTKCPYPLSDEYKRRVPHTTRYPEDMTNVGDLTAKKVWYILPVPRRFLENMGTHIFF